MDSPFGEGIAQSDEWATL